jgi:YfiH family protein
MSFAVVSGIKLHTSHVIPRERFVHGFPERTGGVSTGLRASLNLGKRWGDDGDHVEENRRRLAGHAGYDPAQLQIMRHVHGTAVWAVGEPLPDPAEFDGLICDRPGPVLGAFAADCIPLLFAEPEARVIGAAHSGWRGTIGAPLAAPPGTPPTGPGIAHNVVTRMIERGARADRIRVALGPSIGPCCFEVGAEVVAQFHAALGAVAGMVVPGPRGKDHVDLRIATRVVLERAGVRPDAIDAGPPCTRCEAERFFSYRRDGKDGGVHMAFIAMT